MICLAYTPFPDVIVGFVATLILTLDIFLNTVN